MNANTLALHNLIKQAADSTDKPKLLPKSVNKALDDVALKTALDVLDKRSLENAIKVVKNYENQHPLHISTGLYGHTANTLANAKENLARGNYVRGALGVAVRVPVRAAVDTAMLPLNFLDRALDPNLNTLHRSSDQVQSIVDNTPGPYIDYRDGFTAYRALNELVNAANTNRADPTQLYASTKNKSRVMATNGGSMYAGFGSPEFAAATLAVNPVVQSAIGDTLMLPISLPAKITNSQGQSRADYEAELKRNNK